MQMLELALVESAYFSQEEMVIAVTPNKIQRMQPYIKNGKEEGTLLFCGGKPVLTAEAYPLVLMRLNEALTARGRTAHGAAAGVASAGGSQPRKGVCDRLSDKGASEEATSKGRGQAPAPLKSDPCHDRSGWARAMGWLRRGVSEEE